MFQANLLQGKVILITGGGTGLGRAMGERFLELGAKLAICGRRQDVAEQAAADMALTTGGETFATRCDVRHADQVEAMMDAVIERFGRVDVLVNNAFKGGVEPLMAEANVEIWRQIFDVNVFGSLQLTQSVIPIMRARGGGAIVFINSMSMRVIEAKFGGYAASKGALMVAAQTLAKELGRDKIRVNTVVPGYIWGPALQGYFKSLAQQQHTTPEAVYAEIASRTALNHIPTSEEIADAVIFFASDLSRAITGQALDVNGGHFFH